MLIPSSSQILTLFADIVDQLKISAINKGRQPKKMSTYLKLIVFYLFFFIYIYK